MDVDLLLTIAHHLLVFSLVAILAAEIAAIRPNMNAEQITHLGYLDSAYGAVAGLVLVVGFVRVYFGAKGAEFFMSNWVFWAKVGCFILIGLVSIPPTLRIAGWRKRIKAEPAFRAPAAEVEAAQRFMIGEAILLPFILIFAAMMARGYGL